MPTSVPNFNLLAPLVTEIWREFQNKNWELLISSVLRRPLADKFLHVAIVPENAYQRTKFQLSRFITFGDMRGIST